MQATIRIPLIFLFGSSALYAALSIALPFDSMTCAILRGVCFLLAAALMVHALLNAELKHREAVEASLRQLATHDPLTGLVNRAHFQETLDRALARAERQGEFFGVAYIDLNDFKQINDLHGHHVGDMLLTQVADRISAVVRAGDCAARFGGDEFVVLVDDRTERGVYRLSERLRDAFDLPFDVDGVQLPVTASIGVAFYPNHGRHALNLLKAADQAMYRAKTSRNGSAVTALSSAA